MIDVQLIGNKILSSSDLEKMNQDEVRTRNYKYCTIDCAENGTFLAKVAYSEDAGGWEPVEIEYYGEWILADEFDATEECGSYSCENYRAYQ